MATKPKPAAKPSSASPAAEGIPPAASDEVTPPATPPADEGNAADQAETNQPAAVSPDATPPAVEANAADQTEANPPTVQDRKTYVVLSAVKVGGKWRAAGDKLVGLPTVLADQLAGRIEEDK